MTREYRIFDKDGVEMPDHHSGRLRTYEEAKTMVDRLNKNGEYKPYRMQAEITDVLLNVENCPFITLTETKLSNIWYHEKSDNLFIYTSEGFRVTKGSKKTLTECGFLKN